MITTVNPATDEAIKKYNYFSDSQVKKIIESTNKDFNDWKGTDFNVRAVKMKNVSKIMREKKQDFGRVMSLEMGKPFAQSVGEIEKCAWACDYFAENAEKFLKNEIIKTDASSSYVYYQPLGVILAIMPWNFPFWQVFRFAAPNLMAGNGAILKHAPITTQCGLDIEKIFKDAGFPENLFRTIIYSNEDMKKVIANENIKAVTLTGSVRAGKSVAKYSGNNLKKTVLELGGSDPYLILEDADLEKTVTTCVTSRLINSGQSCIAAKRFIVVDSVYKKFEEMFVETMKQKKIGDPFEDGIDLGPQASSRLRNNLHKQVKESLSKGAKVLLGGKISGGKGAYYPPTVISNIKKGMPAYEEELFGPAAALIKVKNEEEAVRIANDTSYGLGAAVFTSDLDKGKEIAEKKLYAGSCFVNEFVKSDPRLPFGGIKNSGYGRELSVFGIKEFVNLKTVYIK